MEIKLVLISKRGKINVTKKKLRFKKNGVTLLQNNEKNLFM